ncbi:hypothetical protein AAG570_000436 [Ranatra chinensis]|uniref:Ig-like domain-containing protein n=1 Tax=Ranatra chinensis TaxID=642074 RepID=A0ABD0YX28_9HEMI
MNRYPNCSAEDIGSDKRTQSKRRKTTILKFLRISAVSNVEDLQVLNISVVYFLWSSGAGDVVFHFFGSGHDVGRVKEAGSHLVERGRLGEVHLVPGQISMVQEPALALESVRVRHKEQMIREGDQFMLSCVAQGSSYMTFQWFKDGALINPKKSLRTIWTQLLPLDSHEQYTAILGLENVDAMDEGQYTCQVVDWGVQECKSIYIEIKQPPQVVISPMSATVHKKSTTYTCQAHTSVATQSQSVRVDVINRTNIAVCQAESVDGVTWGDASPGSTAISDCPTRDGSEMTYEIMSDIISVSASGALRDLQIKLELPLKRGLIMLLCYVLCSEISMHHLVFKHLKFDKGKEKDCNSDSDNNLFDCKKTPDKEEVDLEDYPNSPRKYVQITGGGDASRPVTYQFDESNYPSAIVHSSDRGGRDLCVEYIGSSCGDDVVSARVRLELDVVQSVLNPSSTVETPLVKCSIDLESAPCTSSAGLNEFTVTSGDSSKSCHVELKETEPSEQSPECGDVLDRISHDLDYLLNRTSDTGGGSDTFKRQRTTAVSTEPNVQGSKANSSS